VKLFIEDLNLCVSCEHGLMLIVQKGKQMHSFRIHQDQIDKLYSGAIDYVYFNPNQSFYGSGSYVGWQNHLASSEESLNDKRKYDLEEKKKGSKENLKAAIKNAKKHGVSEKFINDIVFKRFLSE
jgi:hypothetical protein